VSLLEVQDLKVHFETEDGVVKAVDGVSFAVETGRTLGIVGESGCGKSVANMTILGLTRSPITSVSGRIMFEGTDLAQLPAEELQRVRGNDIAMIFQDPLTSLHPFHKVGKQLVEAILVHQDVSKAAARKRAVELFGLVGIPDAKRRVNEYPHEFSGGMRQRAMIAMALVNDPKILIADEPTTALDVTVQRQILELISDLVAERGMALMLISHDLGVIAQNVAQMLVMYGGSVVESGPTDSVFANRMHPYSLGLFAARPGLRSQKGRRLATIPGTVPELIDLPPGCPFAGRCSFTIPECHVTVPPPFGVEPGHQARCIRLDAVAAAKEQGVAA
jgi:peptide/nickel transport system ATP-binding protein